MDGGSLFFLMLYINISTFVATEYDTKKMGGRILPPPPTIYDWLQLEAYIYLFLKNY